jgi:molecular chaperone HtpG
MLQQNPMLEKIKNNLVKSVLKNLEEMKTTSYDDYVAFFTEFGAFLKEGLSHDYVNREALSKLMLFESMKTEEKNYISLSQYVEAMPEGQTEIYYLTGESRDLVAHTPYLEVFKSKGWDVLFMTDPIDEFILPSLTDFDGKKLVAADKSDVSLPSEKETAEAAKEYAPLFAALKGKLDMIKEVRVSTRLKESASCLVSDKDAMSANMERIMQKLNQGGDVRKTDRILELNVEHPVVIALKKLFTANADDARVGTYAQLLYDQAVIAEGSKVKDPVAFANMINELLVQNAGV